MAHKELSLESTSFYDLPTIKPTGNDVPSDGPVRDIPARAVATRANMVAMKQQVPGMTKIADTPENDPRSWNMELPANKKPING